MYTAMFCLVSEPVNWDQVLSGMVNKTVLHEWIRERCRKFSQLVTHEVLGGFIEHCAANRNPFLVYKPRAISPSGIVSYAVLHTEMYNKVMEEFWVGQREVVQEKAELENVYYTHLYDTELRKSLMRRETKGNVIYPEIWQDE